MMSATNTYLREGYAAGSGEGEWLTVWGSAYDDRLVFATAPEAEARALFLRAHTVEKYQDSIVVRRVRRTDLGWYRIVTDHALGSASSSAH
jgi:hypothetical protein